MSEKLINLDNLAYYDSKIKTYIGQQVAEDGVQYLGVVNSQADLDAITNMGNGDYVRVGTAFGDAHAGDLFIYETNSWTLIHCHNDSNTTYTLTKNGKTIILTDSNNQTWSVADEGGELEELVSLAGDNKTTLNINDCTVDASADYAIVGGTNDQTVISNILGSLASNNVNIEKPIINADCGISFGSGTIVNSTGGNAIGVWNTSGVKGFYWESISKTADNKYQIILSNTQDTVGTYYLTESSFQEAINNNTLTDISSYKWTKDDIISIVNDSKYPACAKISSISSITHSYTATVGLSSKTKTATRVAIVVDSLPFSERASVDLQTPDDYTIYACYEKSEVTGVNSRWYPRSGAVELGWAGTAFGVENLVTGSGGFAGGWNNWQAGDFGAVFGRDNISGYASLVSGNNNTVPATQALVTGSSNQVTGNSSIVGGSGSTVASGNTIVGGANHSLTDGSSCTVVSGDGNILTKSWCSAVFGNGNTVSAQSSIVGGIKNTVQGSNSLVVGNTNTTLSGNSILSGYNNKIFASSSGSVVSGEGNKLGETANSAYGAIFGHTNAANGGYCLIGGKNNTSNSHCNIMSGENNTANGNDSAIFGQGNTSGGSQTFITGLNNTIATSCGESAIFGNNNNIGSDAEVTLPDGTTATKTGITNIFVAGKNNKAYASCTILAGQANIAWNGNAAIFGYNNQARAYSTIIAGDGNIATKGCQAVFGLYNDYSATSNDLFVIGNGLLAKEATDGYTEETNNTGGTIYVKRRNAFRVTSGGDVITSGKITAGAAPTEDMDVVNLAYLKNYLLDKEW